MAEKSKNQEIIARSESLPSEISSNKILLGNHSQVDLSGLSDQQIQQLRVKHAEALIALDHKAKDLHIDVGATGAVLGTMASNVQQVSQAGDAVTITHVQKNSLGQTEVIMGNTETALKGKISNRQRGQPDHTLWYVLIAAIVIVIIAMSHHV